MNKNDLGPWFVIIFMVSIFSFMASGLIVEFVEHPASFDPNNQCTDPDNPATCPLPLSDYGAPVLDTLYLSIPVIFTLLLAFYWVKKRKGWKFTRA